MRLRVQCGMRVVPNLPLAPGSHTEKKLAMNEATPAISKRSEAEKRG